MVPAFGFGVGDFIAGLVLLKHTFEAFGDAKGAKASYRELAGELSSIQSALESIQAHKCYSANPGAVLQAGERCQECDSVKSDAVLKAVDRCQECVDRFLRRLAKFEDLSVSRESKWSLPTLKNQIHKVEWALCKKSDIEAFRKELHTHKVAILSLQSTLLSAQGASHKELSHRIHDSVNTQIQIVKDIQRKVSRGDHLENSECLRALFITDPLADRMEIENRKDSLMDDSCRWILDNESFIDFNASDSMNEILWLHGGPGKGKTMIAISLVDLLSANISNMEKSILCFFFCDNTDAKRNTTLNALKSILHQLLKQSPDNILLPDFQTQGAQMFSTVEAVWMCLVRVLEASVLRTVHILIDGLDECDGESLEALLSLVCRYSSTRSKQTCHIRWIFTSRDDQSIKEHLQRFINIDLEANSEQVARAVKAFIDLKVEELAVRKHYDSSLKQFVIDNLREKSEGTFLWVSLACSELRKRTVSSVNTRLVLGKLPPGLSRLYDRIMDQVLNNEIEEMVELALEILRAVTIALRPLNLGELAVMSGLSNEARMSFGLARDYAEQCGSFLAFRNDYVYLVHQSAKDYLLRHPQRLLCPQGLIEEHKKAALQCLKYVTDDWQQDILGPCPAEATNLKYPLVNWIDHSNLASENFSTAYSLHADFLRSNSQIRRDWLSYFQKNGQIPNLRHIRPYNFSALHISAVCNTVWVAEQLLQDRLEFIDFKDSYGLSPLHWAVKTRSFQMAELLLQKGADPNNKGRLTKSEVGPRRGTPLGLASSFNDIKLVQLLLKHGADVNSEDLSSMTPLTWSITKNALPVTRFLLQNGAEVNRRNPISKTPLHIAAALGNIQMVRTLLDAGAAIRAADIHGCSPVHESVFNGHTDVTNLLAKRGASRYDINQADQWSMYQRNKRTADDSQRLSQDTSPLRSWGTSKSRSGPSGRPTGYSPIGGVQPGTTVPALKSWGFIQQRLKFESALQ